MISSDYCNMFLEKLRLDGCDSIDDISPESIPRARTLDVSSCHNLTRFLIPTGTESLDISNCENVKILSVACGTQMTSLYISNCMKLKRLPERMQELLPSLNTLHLEDCPEIESFPEGGLPFNLQLLEIINCKKLVNGRKEWRLERLPCLRELWIFHDGSDEEIVADENWELPLSIRQLIISNLKTLSSQVLKSFTSLECLWTYDLPQIQSLLEEGLPTSLSKLRLYFNPELHSLPSEGLRHLTSLRSLDIHSCNQLQSLAELALPSSLSQLTISDFPNLQSLAELALPSSLSQLTINNCRNLQSLAELALPSSLSQLIIVDCPNLQSLAELALPSSVSELTIYGCHNLQSLAELALPSSLSELTIWNCRNLQSLAELALPSSLSRLSIWECPNLQSLPVQGMPSSLSALSIRKCPLLKPLLEFDKGEYWPKIAHISTIVIDGEYL